MDGLNKRLIAREVTYFLEDQFVIVIKGVIGSGKKSISKKMPGYQEVDFSNKSIYNISKLNPYAFIKSLPPKVIFLQLESAPHLMEPIIDNIKHLQSKNRGLLTNTLVIISNNTSKYINHIINSINANVIYSTPLLASETVVNGDIGFIYNIFNKKHYPLKMTSPYQYDTIIKSSSFPELVANKFQNRDQILENIFQTIAKEFFKNTDEKDIFRRFLKQLTIKVGEVFDSKFIAKELGIAIDKCKDLFKIAIDSHLVITIDQWSPLRNNPTPRIMHIIDTNFALYLLGEKSLDTSAHKEKLIKNFIAIEIFKQIQYYHDKILYHFQSYKPCPFDYIIEDSNEKTIASINVILGKNIDQKVLKKINQWTNHQNQPFLKNIILYLGDEVIRYENNIIAIPISTLWDSGPT